MTLVSNKQALEPFTINSATTVGGVTLAVANLEQMVRFYEQAIGLTVLNHTSQGAELGIEGTPIVRLEASSNGKRYARATGLYHLAILLPSRQALGHWLKHYISSQGKLIDGAGDHLVSEALYLSDPEGNGLEIYRDRPRETWQYNGERVKMDTLPVDLPALIAEAPHTPWRGMPAGTTLGHVHLQVHNVASVVSFYRDILGFTLTEEFWGAGFLGAGGYHHHIGVNVWHTKGAAPPPPGALGLLTYTIVLASEEERETIFTRLKALNYPIDESAEIPLVRDPSGIGVLLKVAS